MSTRYLDWTEALDVFRVGMKLLVRLDGFEYAGQIEKISAEKSSDILSFDISDIQKRSWSGILSKTSIPWSNHTLSINMSKSLVSDIDKNKRWYFTLPRAGHGIVSRK